MLFSVSAFSISSIARVGPETTQRDGPFIAAKEISSLMILDGTNRTVRNRNYMKRGDRVMIMEGPLKGLVGFYVKHRGRSDKVVVSIELLQRSLAVEIEDWALEKIP